MNMILSVSSSGKRFGEERGIDTIFAPMEAVSSGCGCDSAARQARVRTNFGARRVTKAAKQRVNVPERGASDGCRDSPESGRRGDSVGVSVLRGDARRVGHVADVPRNALVAEAGDAKTAFRGVCVRQDVSDNARDVSADVHSPGQAENRFDGHGAHDDAGSASVEALCTQKVCGAEIVPVQQHPAEGLLPGQHGHGVVLAQLLQQGVDGFFLE